MINLQDRVINGEQIVIDNHETFNAIGVDVTLQNCIVRCSVPAKSLSIRGTLIDTTIVAEKQLAGFSWLQARLVACTFEGGFKENNFGTVSQFEGYCRDGDFMKADLDDCVFYGPSCASHRFPVWPHFTILDIHQNVAEMKRRNDSDRFVDFIESIEGLSEEANALACNALSIAKELEIDVGDLKTFVSGFSFVRS